MRILFVGESAEFYQAIIKGYDLMFMARREDKSRYVATALRRCGFEVEVMPTERVPVEFPEDSESLDRYDVIIVSDVGSNSFLLHPEVVLRSTPRPNRLKLIREYVRRGGGFAMIGGYMSFQGLQGRANYRGTPIEEILPVSMMVFDDRVEVPEGFRPLVVKPHHQILKGIPRNWPTFLGYNKTTLKEGADLLLSYNGDPILAVWDYGKGRTMAFTTDCAPHWATREFLEWEYYPIFWKQAVEWLAGRLG